MENDTQVPEQNDVQQQFDQLKSKHDRLLHKHVALLMSGYCHEHLEQFALFVVLAIAGIVLHSTMGLGWPVIIAILMTMLCSSIVTFLISRPVAESRVSKTPIETLRENVIKFGRNRKIYQIILTIVMLLLTFWLAFAFKDALRRSLWEEITSTSRFDESSVAFYVILFFGCLLTIIFAYGIFQDDKSINKVIDDIDEAKM